MKLIADFLELKPSEELIEEIANKCEFQTMSKFKTSNIPEAMRMVTDVRDKHIMYRKGKNIFTISTGKNGLADIDSFTNLKRTDWNIRHFCFFIPALCKESKRILFLFVLLIFLVPKKVWVWLGGGIVSSSLNI